MAKVRSVGTTLKIGKTGATTTVGGLKNINGIEASADTVDVTALDNAGGYKEYLMGFKDAGEVSCEGFLDDSDAGQAAIYEAFNSGEVQKCEIEFPNGAKWTFDGIITNFSTNASVEDAVSFSTAIKVSGKPTFTFTTI